MTYSAQNLDLIAELILDRMQVTANDVALHAGMSPSTAEEHLRELQRQGRAHRVHQTIPLSGIGTIWAPGRRLRADGLPVFEPVHVSVQNWKATPFRISALEAHFFGRVPAPSLLGATPEMVMA